MSSITTVPGVSLAQQAVLRTLAYFDVFSHPLTAPELLRYSAVQVLDLGTLEIALHELAHEGMVERVGDHWGLRSVSQSVLLREAAEKRAGARMPKALRMSSLIARFPFVRAVFLSGSMSKGCLAEDGDIDYFVITEPGRLWIARTLLILYKKIFLLNSRRDFCVNYFLDTDHLTVEDRNLFTATEVTTLIPTYGKGAVEAFFDRNAWAFAMFPAAAVPVGYEVPIGRALQKDRMEGLLNGTTGQWLDRWCMQLTWYRWKRKFNHLDPRTFELALRTRTYVSKHHPRNFQERVLDAYNERIHTLEKRLGNRLS